MSDYVIVNGELKHYGVPGMKWGVRKKPFNTYTKAIGKKDKLEFKYVNYLDKSERDFAKSGKMYLTEFGKARNAKALRNSARNMAKAKRYEKKAQKWIKAMSETFSETNLSQISDELKKKGADYRVKANNLVIKGDGTIIDKITEKRKTAYMNKSDKLRKQASEADLVKEMVSLDDFSIYEPPKKKKRK